MILAPPVLYCSVLGLFKAVSPSAAAGRTRGTAGHDGRALKLVGLKLPNGYLPCGRAQTAEGIEGVKVVGMILVRTVVRLWGCGVQKVVRLVPVMCLLSRDVRFSV